MSGTPPVPPLNDHTPPPPPPPITFPEYGQGGDYAGQRRARRSFRYAVVAVVAFVLALRIYEGYAKLDLYESQYRMSLTLADASARPILRNIIKRETEVNGQPTPLFVEALAGVEEDDRVLGVYEEATRLAPSNQALLLKYGCVLFQRQEFDKAREKFREAGVHQPRNALPNYLEAAALAASLKDGADLSEPLAIVVRANTSGAPLVFPAPLWHGSLPSSGEYFVSRRRDMGRRIAAPLSQFKQLIVERARHDIESGNLGDWDAWLDKLQDMGHRIATARNEDGEAEATQVMAGVNIEMDAVALRKEIATKNGGDTKPFDAQYRNLSNAMAHFAEFENARQEGIDASRIEVTRPLKLAAEAIVPTFALYLLVWIVGLVLGVGQRSVALAHARLGTVAIVSGVLVLAAALHLLSLPHFGPSTAQTIEIGALGVIGVILMFGTIYPAVTLPPVGTVLAAHGGAPAEIRPAAKKARLTACFALNRRYFGALLGGFVIAVSIWFITFRLASGVYPHQTDLLVSGMEQLERDTISQALAGTQ